MVGVLFRSLWSVTEYRTEQWFYCEQLLESDVHCEYKDKYLIVKMYLWVYFVNDWELGGLFSSKSPWRVEKVECSI